MDRKEFKESHGREITVAKQVQTRKQKEVDEEFLSSVDSSIKKDEKLLKKLAKK